MDDETPEMEAITDQMRELMLAWIEDPGNAELKAEYTRLQNAYHRAFLEYKRSDRRIASSEAAHQAYS